ncbi:hypothetical protein FKP32DRAFT_889243 [Trametes sanguinea]|nr:hypothetical protein FKP32DRAFT_889243 [Trametes sanguinea]
MLYGQAWPMGTMMCCCALPRRRGRGRMIGRRLHVPPLSGHLSVSTYWVSNCALVCRAWPSICRPIIFEKLRFQHCDIKKYYRFRLRFDSAPHLHPLVREVMIRDNSRVGSTAVEVLLSIIIRCLPALRSFIWQNPIYANGYHRFFSNPNFRLPTITTLDLIGPVPRNLSGLFVNLHLFTNLKTLKIFNLGWMDSRGPRDAGLRRRGLSIMRRLPNISRLYLATRHVWDIDRDLKGGFAELDAYEGIFEMLCNTLEHLDINFGTFCFFTHPKIESHAMERKVLNVPNVTILDIYMRSSSMYSEEPQLPYSVQISYIPKFLRAVFAPGLRIITLHFSCSEMFKSAQSLPEFIEHLHQINHDLTLIVQSSHFPLLQSIRVDVYCIPAWYSWWKSQILWCFPLLVELGLMELMIVPTLE